MDMYTTTVKFFQEGGIFMYPIALVAALGAAVAIERWLHLWRTESANRRMWDEVAPFLKTGDFKRAIAAPSGRSSGTAWRACRPPSAATTSRRRWRKA